MPALADGELDDEEDHRGRSVSRSVPSRRDPEGSGSREPEGRGNKRPRERRAAVEPIDEEDAFEGGCVAVEVPDADRRIVGTRDPRRIVRDQRPRGAIEDRPRRAAIEDGEASELQVVRRGSGGQPPLRRTTRHIDEDMLVAAGVSERPPCRDIAVFDAGFTNPMTAQSAKANHAKLAQFGVVNGLGLCGMILGQFGFGCLFWDCLGLSGAV